MVENHEPCIVAFEQPHQEFHADTCEAVAVGHHNFCDSAATDGVQKGKEADAFPVDTTARVLDEFVVGIGALEIATLTLEIGALMGAADTGVANAAAWLRFVETDLVFEVGEAVEALACPALTPDDFNLALFSPAAKRTGADIVTFANGRTAHVLWIQQKSVQTVGNDKKVTE